MARQKVRIMCHGSGVATSVQGKYKAAAGTMMDTFDDSAEYLQLTSNGWLRVAVVGTTAERPVQPHAPSTFVDTTLGKMIVYDGVVWRDPSSGSVV